MREIQAFPGGIALVFEKRNYLTLREFIKEGFSRSGNFLGQENFLKLAIALSEALVQAHSKGIFHQSIHPENIIIDRENKNPKLINFGTWPLISKNDFGSNFQYISPEQTGRINRAFDYRSDFYSLGMVFYEILAGHSAFSSSSIMELIHSHIAKDPIAPSELDSYVPLSFSDIVMKMISKATENRYQSAYGLKKDMEECLRNKGEISESFVPGRFDSSDKLFIPEKIYGRGKELKILQNAFYKVTKKSREVVFVSAPSGAGKSSLIYELQPDISRHQGYFISGKYQKRNKPYSAIIYAFKDLFRQILIENEEETSKWKEKLEIALGHGRSLISQVLPEINLIMGEPPVEVSSSLEKGQKRLVLAFHQLVKIFCEQERPLVLFLDDLQWIDLASLYLLKSLMTSSDLNYFMIIGTYRDSEIQPTDSLALALEEFKEDSNINLTLISLPSLNRDHITQLLADTFQKKIEDAKEPKELRELEELKELANVIYLKTNGNPFFLKQLFQVYGHKFLHYSRSTGWEWDLEKISDLEGSYDIVELMVGKITSLPKASQKILTLASILETIFSIKTLSLVYDASIEDTFEQLSPLLEKNLVLDLRDGNYRILHDRVRQTSYKLITEKEKKKIHFQAGKKMWKNFSDKEQEEQILNLVYHLNYGIDFVTEAEEKQKLAKLNLLAAKKSKTTAAYDYAFTCLNTALNLIEEDNTLFLQIQMEIAECHFASGNLDKALEAFNSILKDSPFREDKLKAYNAKMALYTAKGDREKAVQTGIEGLRFFGVNVPISPSLFNIMREILQVKWNLRGIEISELEKLPTVKDEKIKARISLLANLAPPAHFINKELQVLVSLKMLNFFLRYGNTEDSPFAYAFYGIMQVAMGNIEKGYEFGKLGLNLTKKHYNPVLECRINLHCAFINQWQKHLISSVPYYKKSLIASKEICDLNYAGYCYINLMNNMLIRGEKLGEIISQIEKYLEVLLKTNYQENINSVLTIQQMLFQLSGKTEDLQKYFKNSFIEKQQVSQMKTLKHNHCLHAYYNVKIQILYLMDQYEEGFEFVQISDKEIKNIFAGQMNLCEHFFYYCLIALALIIEKQKKGIPFKKIEKYHKQIYTWSNTCEANFGHKAFLIQAEIANLKGKDREAMDFYEKAIKSARTYNFIQNEAIAYERAAKFYLSRGFLDIAKPYMIGARRCYLSWGANEKAKLMERNLEEKYPLFFPKVQSISELSTFDLTFSSAIDVQAVLEFSQTLSQEINLERLLKEIMKIVMKNAGAEKVFLLLDTKGQLSIEGAIHSQKENGEPFLPSIPIENSKELSVKVVRYVQNLQKEIIIDDAVRNVMFGDDPYVVINKTKSILCLPIIKGAKFVGVFYLENNLVPYAFNENRLSILKMLAVQAAISIENAKLYEDLRQENTERKKAEKESHRGKQKLEHAITQLHYANQKNIRQERLFALGEMVSGIAHDFDNSLSPVLGFSDLLLIRPEYLSNRDKTIEFLEMINIAARDASNIVARLRDFYRPKEDNENFAPMDINKVVRQAIQLAEPRRKVIAMSDENSKNICLQKQIEDLPLILGDDGEIRELLINLIFNAFDAIKDTGEVTISTVVKNIRRKKITLQGEEEESIELSYDEVDGEETESSFEDETEVLEPKILLKITDTGIGMDEKTQRKCLEPFFSTKGEKGTGMGLPMVYGTVQGHGGSIEIESEVGKGTSFLIYFPIPKEISYIPQKREFGELPPLHILVAEDDALTRRLLMEYLTYFNCTFDMAINGKEALHKFNHHEFNIVITDRSMPEMRGDQLAFEIKSISPETPIIMITALGEIMKIKNEEPEHIDFLMSKPINRDELQKALHDAYALSQKNGRG